MGLGRGIEGTAVAAVWRQAQLIRDPYSGATKGEVQLTLQSLLEFRDRPGRELPAGQIRVLGGLIGQNAEYRGFEADRQKRNRSGGP